MEAHRMHTPNMNTTKLRIHTAILTILSVVLLPAVAAAHNGEQHVIGTVAKISDTSITVKTTAGKLVEVIFDAKTTYTRAKQQIHKTDIKAGDRIVIHAVEVKEKLTAHTIEIGAVTGAQAKE